VQWLAPPSKKITTRHHWQHRLDQCNIELPHQCFINKVSGNDQLQALQFENTYTLNVRLSDDRQNGSIEQYMSLL
jgi:hypothetical protein